MTAVGVFYDVASSRLDEQIGRIDALDAKTSTIYGFTAALLPIFGVFFATTNPPPLATTLYIIAIVLYCGLLVATTAAYRVTDWSLRPDPCELEQHSRTYSEDVVRQWAADECVRSITANEPQLDRKSTWVTAASWLLALDALLLSLAAVATFS
jgi:hypothetical protein